MNKRQIRLPSIESAEFVEAMYREYLQSPADVPDPWRHYFDELNGANAEAELEVGRPFKRRSIFNPAPLREVQVDGRPLDTELLRLQDRVNQLIRAYRVRGHIQAKLDPLEQHRGSAPELELAYHGLTEKDLDRKFSTAGLFDDELRTLREILHRLQLTYCEHVGVQYMHIDDDQVRLWIQHRLENPRYRKVLSHEQQLRILRGLTDAVVFEEFLQTRYVGAKSFSLEGGESLIPLLWLAIQTASEQGVREIVFGMAHRGRLNVLANIIGKSPQQIFREFEDRDTQSGDVKYHLGYSGDWQSATGQDVHLSLCFNPSHLEFVNPIALGRVRAKQDRNGDLRRRQTMAILIHGDAAFAGEGVVQESLNLSELDAYRCGGTLHVIVNNQIGFTTGPKQGRSSPYATDVARSLQIPIFHVNGESPDAVASVVQLAMEFREQFQRDVVVDMYCYRRRGHNESDEPSFTQPLLYRVINNRKPVREGYLDSLLALGTVSREVADRIEKESKQRLEEELKMAEEDEAPPLEQAPRGVWQGYVGGPVTKAQAVDTRLDRDTASQLLTALSRVPDGFNLHRTLQRGMKRREEMAAGERPLDWPAAEALAFASLAVQGIPIRLSGEDSERGTFSQRHAVLHDIETGKTYCPLQHLNKDQAEFQVYNSPLSETAVLGYEYGYSLDYPHGLVLWEAQFGDFVNVAQVIIDQFIASAEQKWQRLSGLVLLLPHGYEGMGPEHSSARLERFLNLAADDNMQIVYPSTPAQYFHVLRRQGLWKWRKPLVILTPKSLLRNVESSSDLASFTDSGFQSVIDDDQVDPANISRLVLCTGKIYFELRKQRDQASREDIAIVRVEQFYPQPLDALQQVVDRYPNAECVWVQEEPENMGAWYFLRDRLWRELPGERPIRFIGRKASASPATGSKATHQREQEALLAAAIGEVKDAIPPAAAVSSV